MRRSSRREKVSGREKGFMVVALASIVLAAYVVFYGQPANVAGADISAIEDLSTEGFVEVEAAAAVVDGRGAVSLTGGCVRMTAGTEPDQAQAISDGINEVVGPRPNTHDLMRDAFDMLDIELLMVKVTELRDRNFHGKVLLRQGDTILSLDARPSDGVALAVRTGSKIYFNETLLNDLGQRVC